MDFSSLNAISRAKQSLMASSKLSYQHQSVVVDLQGLNKLRMSHKEMITRTTSHLPRGMLMVYNLKFQLIITDSYSDVELPEPSHNLYECEWVGGDVPRGLVSSFIAEAINLGLITKDDFASPVVSVFTLRPIVDHWRLENNRYQPVYRLMPDSAD